MKLRKKLLAIILSTIMAMSMVFYFPGQARADALDNVVSELQKTYVWLDKDPVGKASVAQAKTEAGNILGDPNIAPWPAVFNKLPVNKLVGAGKFASESEAKQALVDLFLDAAIIGYSSDAGVLKTNLENFKIEHADTIYKVMGNDVTVDELYNCALQTKKEIPGIITEDISGLIAIAGGDYSTIREQVKDWLWQALIKADTGNKYQSKLNSVDWSIDALIEAKDIISKVADPDYLAEIALLKAYVRSETRFLKNGVALAPETKISLCQGGSLPGKLSILGITDKYGINIAEVFTWQSGNESVIKIEDHTIKAIGTGAAEIIAYNKNPATDWVYKGTVEVAVCPAPGGGGGVAPAPVPVPVPGETSKSIGNDGGSISLGDVNIEIPSGALGENKNISIKKLDQAKAPLAAMEGFKFLGDVYYFGPEGLKFKVPVTITIKYDPTKLTGLDEDTLAIYYYDKTKNAWVIQKSTIDKAKRAVSTKVDHFTCFALMAKTKILPPPCVFNDLTKEHWAYECIITLCRKGIVGGYPDKTFRPGRNITRAEFTKLLVGTLGLAKDTPAQPTFEDVKPADWYYECVETAAKAGLIRGYKGKFRPNDFITRQEMTAIMIRAMGKESEALAKAQEKIDMTDEAQISSWARGCVVLAVESGLIVGYPDKTFGPGKNTTRAEAAVIICRFKKY